VWKLTVDFFFSSVHAISFGVSDPRRLCSQLGLEKVSGSARSSETQRVSRGSEDRERKEMAFRYKFLLQHVSSKELLRRARVNNCAVTRLYIFFFLRLTAIVGQGCNQFKP
jgi:hypothetical protein